QRQPGLRQRDRARSRAARARIARGGRSLARAVGPPRLPPCPGQLHDRARQLERLSVSKQQRQFLDDLRAKSVEAAADMMAGVQRLKALHDDVVGEDAEVDRVRLSDYLYRLAKLELEHAA